MKDQKMIKLIFTAALTLIFAACSDSSTNPSGTNDNNVSMSVKLDEGAGDNSIVITEAKALITNVEVETEPSGVSHSVRINPFVIYFNTSGAVITVTSGTVPPGSYSKIKFKLHKPEDWETPPDPEFKEGTSGNQRYSFIIKGLYNGNSFVYKSRKSVNLVVNFSRPVNFSNTNTNITVLVNPLIWFNNGSLDPRDPSNEDEIDDNIKNSFRRAFRDDDKNGIDDN
jgi:hypothetical protein